MYGIFSIIRRPDAGLGYVMFKSPPKAIFLQWATAAFAHSRPRVSTGSPREPQGNPFHPPSPPRTLLLPETHCKSSLNKISRLGTGSILALYVSALCFFSLLTL